LPQLDTLSRPAPLAITAIIRSNLPPLHCHTNMIKTAFKYLNRYRQYSHWQSAPLWATFAVTENCNCQCQYCDFWHDKNRDMTTEQVHLVLKRLWEGGVESVSFSGGEPLLRRDMAELVAAAVALGFRTNVTTSGTTRPSMIPKLMEAGLSSLSFSLDGATAETHESFRKACPYDSVVRSIRAAVEARNKGDYPTLININTTVHKQNYHEVQALSDFSEQLGVDRIFFQPVWSVYDDPDFMEKYGFTPDNRELLEQVQATLTKVARSNIVEYFQLLPDFYGDYTKTKETPCYAGRAYLHIDGFGNVHPCTMVGTSFGNILDKPLAEMLSGPEANDLIKKCADYQCPKCTLTCYIERNIMIDSIHKPLRAIQIYKNRLKRDRFHGV
jgi:MoaA/NifB/PqqE/SkfB family radical SAM enzyme